MHLSQSDKRLFWSLFATLYFLEHLILYMQVREITRLSLRLEMKFRTVKNKLWVVFKISIKEFCPRVPKDVIGALLFPGL